MEGKKKGRESHNDRTQQDGTIHKTMSDDVLVCCGWIEKDNVNLPLTLKKEFTTTTGKPSTILSTSTLELALTRRLLCCPYDSDDADDSDEDDTVVVYGARNDPHWLHCRLPVSWPFQTILGIYEEEGKEDFPVEVTEYYPDESPASAASISCCDSSSSSSSSSPFSSSQRAPHSLWKRQRRYGSETLTTTSKSLAQKIQSLYWIDLRTLVPTKHGNNDNDPFFFLKTQGGIVHFLRSLLTCSHAASPWATPTACNDYDNDDNTPDIVVLALPKPIPVLSDFRVSDACPSWNLFSVAKCNELETTKFIDRVVRDERPSDNHDYDPPATLYVYKRLKDRPRLTIDHPIIEEKKEEEDSNDNNNDGQAITPTPTPDGCLWEMVPPPRKSSSKDNQTTTTPAITKAHGDPPPLPTYRLQCPPYLNLAQEYSQEIHDLLFAPETLQIFKKEASSIPQWTPWPETHHYSSTNTGDDDDGHPSWTVFPLCYCFPANEVQNRKWVEVTRSFCPQTCEKLQSILGDTLRTALFSRLKPNTVLQAHTGWADLANHVLRLHIPLIVPKHDGGDDGVGGSGGLCGTWVDGCVETHVEGRPLLFDDSKIHRAFNYSQTTARIVLIVDLERPSHLPSGHATGGHSDELDAFIQQMSQPR